MKKTGKFITGVACVATCCAAFLTGCFGGGGDGGSVKNLSSEQVTEMNGAVSTTKNYKGSYTIKETATTVAGAYYGGEAMEEQTQESSAVVSYDAEGKKFLYYADIPQAEVTIYNAKNEDGSWTQYVQSGYYKDANKYSHQKALVESGFTIQNYEGTTISLHFNSLNTAVKSLFYADLGEAAKITDPVEYSEFWSDSYQSLANQLMSAYGVTASYKNGGSSVKTEGESVAYTFEIVGTPNGTPMLNTPQGSFKLKNYKLSLDVTLVVTDGLIDEIRCDVEQTFKVTQSGVTLDFVATSNVVDDFTYVYDGTNAPTADELATFSVTDRTNGVVGDPDEDKEQEETPAPGTDVDVEIDLSKATTVDAVKALLAEEGWTIVEEIPDEDLAEVPNAIGGLGVTKTINGDTVGLDIAIFDSEAHATAYVEELSSVSDMLGLTVKQSGRCVYIIAKMGSDVGGEPEVEVPFLQANTLADAVAALEAADWTIKATGAGPFEGSVCSVAAEKNIDSFIVLLSGVLFENEASALAYMEKNPDEVESSGLIQQGCWVYMKLVSQSSEGDIPALDLSFLETNTVKEAANVLEEGGWSQVEIIPVDELGGGFSNAVGGVSAITERGASVVGVYAVLFDSEASALSYMDEYVQEVKEHGLEQSGSWVYGVTTLGGAVEVLPNEKQHFTSATTLEEAAKILESQGWNTDIYTSASMLEPYPDGVGILAAQRDDNNKAYTTAILFSSEESATTYMRTNPEQVEKYNFMQVGCWVYEEKA